MACAVYTSFDLRLLPEGTLDLFGVRYEDFVVDPAPAKFIIRPRH
jgi:hypothetical protein